MKVIFDPILGALRKSDADGVGTGTVTGTGTAGYIAAWTTATNIGNSIIYNNATTVSIGNASPSAKAIFETSSTTLGVLFPRMTQAQRDAIAPGSAANLGLFVYNTDTALYDYWDGSTWNEIMTSIVTTELEPVSTQTNTPTATTLGLRALIGTAPTGVWVGKANQIAEGDGAGGYTYTVPVLNNIVYITDTLTTKRYNGSAWIAYPGTAILQNGNSLTTNMSIGTNQLTGSRGLYFKTSGTNRLLIGGAGNFHVGTSTFFGDLTTAPTATVHAQGSTADSTAFAGKFQNSSGAQIAQFRNDQAAIFAGPIAVNGGIDTTYALTVTAKTGGLGRLLDSGSNEFIKILDNHTLTFLDSGANTSRFGIGQNASSTSRIYIRGIGTTTAFGIYISDSTETPVLFSVQDGGKIRMASLPTSNAGLSTGDLYVASAATILANSDLVVGWKV